jgi:hypothetical protein
MQLVDLTLPLVEPAHGSTGINGSEGTGKNTGTWEQTDQGVIIIVFGVYLCRDTQTVRFTTTERAGSSCWSNFQHMHKIIRRLHAVRL